MRWVMSFTIVFVDYILKWLWLFVPVVPGYNHLVGHKLHARRNFVEQILFCGASKDIIVYYHLLLAQRFVTYSIL